MQTTGGDVLGAESRAEPLGPQVVEEEDHLSWLTPMALIVFSGFVLFVVLGWARANLEWVGPFWRDLIDWLAHPRIAGGWTLPARPILGAVILVAALALGATGSRQLLAGTPLASDRILLAGFTILLAVCVLGYVGTLAIVFRELTPAMLWAALAACGIVLAVLHRALRTRDRSRGSALRTVTARSRSGEWRRLRAVSFAVSALIVSFIFAHATLGPVQEWDAIVYHAESARVWFFERPEPPVLAGPSVGIQISSNYPPLFPAAGAAMYTLLGRFDDFYQRLLSPALFAALLLLLYGWGRHRLEAPAAALATLFVLGSPLMILYAAWPTGYMLLAALLLGVVILTDLAANGASLGRWAAVGLLAGLAILSHFYGLLAIPATLAIALVHRPRRWPGIALCVGVALAVASPWLLRNVIELRDPFYPLGSPLFEGKGLVEPIWSASKEEISRNALAYWGDVNGVNLRIAQLSTALFDRHLLPLGMYFGLLLGLTMWRRNRLMAYLSLVLGGVVVATLLPGWFWLRALVPALPIAALLSGGVFAAALRPARRAASGTWTRRLEPLSRFLVSAAVIVSAGGGVLVGFSLAIAGPNQQTWTTSLKASDDMMRSVENWGSPREQLWATYAGDLIFWEWLNEHLGAGVRVATLEIRTYYIEQPSRLFYLDGIESLPLLNLEQPKAVERFFLERKIRYVALPSWSVSGPTRHPIVGRMPLFQFLGTKRFPAVAAFAPKGTEQPTVVYAVGPTTEQPIVGVFAGAGAPAYEPHHPLVTFETGRVDPRVFIPAPQQQAAALVFDYDASGPGRIEVNLYDRGDWRFGEPILVPTQAADPGWTTAVLPLPPTRRAYLDLGIYVIGSDFRARGFRVIYPQDPIPVNAGRPRLADASAEYVFAEGDTRARILVPVDASGRAVVRFQYWDGRTGSFDLNVLRPGGEWETGVVSRELAGSRAWVPIRMELTSSRPGFVQVGVFARSTDLRVRDIDS